MKQIEKGEYQTKQRAVKIALQELYDGRIKLDQFKEIIFKVFPQDSYVYEPGDRSEIIERNVIYTTVNRVLTLREAPLTAFARDNRQEILSYLLSLSINANKSFLDLMTEVDNYD
jgi:hypothetical protein